MDVIPKIPTKIRLKAQTRSRLNQVLEINFKPSHKYITVASRPPARVIAKV